MTAALLSVLGAARAATQQAMSEAQFRSEMGFTAAQQLHYQAEDGATIDYADFGKRVQGGSTFEMQKTAQGVVSLRLKKPGAADSARPLPDFLPPLELTSIDGQRLRGADFADRPLLLSFFFADCVPCIQEVPILNGFAGKHPEYHYLAVTFDRPDAAAQFVQRYHLKWPVVAAAQGFMSSAGVTTFPTYLLVSRQGRILARSSGLDERAVADPGQGLRLFEEWVAAAR